MFHKRRLSFAGALVSLGLVLGSGASVSALPAWGTAPTVHNSTSAVMPKVVNLRYARHASFDRVVIDLSGRRPAYDVRYVDRLTYDPSGRPVPLTGRNKMLLTLHPATGHSGGTNLYRGPRLRQVDLPTLRGIAMTGDWEGVVSFGFTTRTKPYRIFTMTDPSRVVLDWRH